MFADSAKIYTYCILLIENTTFYIYWVCFKSSLVDQTQGQIIYFIESKFPSRQKHICCVPESNSKSLISAKKDNWSCWCSGQHTQPVTGGMRDPIPHEATNLLSASSSPCLERQEQQSHQLERDEFITTSFPYLAGV